MRRPSVTTEGIAHAGAKLAGGLSVLVVFLVVVLGGGVYRTDCTTSNGKFITDWGTQGDIPYLWSPSDNHCKAHTLMRYVLGKVGVMAAISTPDQAYTAALIKQVGAGSLAEEQLLPTLESLKNVGGFSDPGTQQAMLYLLQGQLNKISQSDLVRLADENRTAATRIGPVLAKLNRLAASISGTTVDASSFPKLPADSKTFIADWNDYLTATSGALRSVSQALSGMNPLYNEFDQLLRAAYNTAQLRSTAQFDKVHAAVSKDMAPRYARMQVAQQSVSAGHPVEQKLVTFVNGSQDAQAIVTRVNHDYPSGFVAQEFKHN